MRPALQAASDCFEVNGAMAVGDGDSSSLSSFGHLRPGVSHKGVEGSRFGFSAGAARLLYQAVINIDLKGDDRWHEVRLVLVATMGETRRGSHDSTPTSEREREREDQGRAPRRGGPGIGLGWKVCVTSLGLHRLCRVEPRAGVWPLAVQTACTNPGGFAQSKRLSLAPGVSVPAVNNTFKSNQIRMRATAKP